MNIMNRWIPPARRDNNECKIDKSSMKMIIINDNNDKIHSSPRVGGGNINE